MKKRFLSTNNEHLVWLSWGMNKLRQFQIIAKSGGVKLLKHYPMDDDVMVTVDTTQDAVTVQELPIKDWFGSAGAVAMRCWCRGIQLVETEGPAPVAVSAPYAGVPWSYNPVPAFVATQGTITYRIVWPDGHVETGSGVAPTMTARPNLFVSTTYTNYMGRSGVGNGTNTAIVGPDGTISGTSGVTNTPYATYYGPQIAAAADAQAAALAAAQAAADEENARRAEEAGQRSAAFLTDGTELASAPTHTVRLYGTKPNSLEGITTWRGDGVVPLFDKTTAAIGTSVVRTAGLTITVPDDVCYQKVSAPAYGGTDGAAAQWAEEWTAAQAAALTREHARRKKCSDGQLAYLRAGFMSPEIEVFLKQQHPRSTKVRRSIPMTITANTTGPVVERPVGSDITTITTTTRTVTLSYTHIVNGQSKVETESFTGTMVVTSHRPSDAASAYHTTWENTTYNTYPMLTTTSTGASGQTYTTTTDGKLVAHDTTTQPLMFVQSGTTISNPLWIPDDSLGAAAYDSRKWLTEFPKSTAAGVTRTHPQFLLDYMQASKPVEIDPNVPADLASTNWLSSRLAHGEIVTIIPLSLVNDKGEDRGMYPYSRTDEPPAQIKVVGYAKFKYDYYIGTFTFVSWTEFVAESTTITHDGAATYDKETDPTRVEVNGTAYTLEPRYFAYSTEWATANCVCCGSKTPWTDTKTARKTQKKNIAEGGTPANAAERLYAAVAKAIA